MQLAVCENIYKLLRKAKQALIMFREDNHLYKNEFMYVK